MTGNGICSACFLRKRRHCGKLVRPFRQGLRRATSPGAGESFPKGGKAFGKTANFTAPPKAPLGGAVAQRLRGNRSAEPEKTVKRSSRRRGVNLQFFPVEPTALGLSRASSPGPVAGWVESRGREGGVGTPLPTSGPAERPCQLTAGRKLPLQH